MTIDMRPYAGAADLQRILDLKRACTITTHVPCSGNAWSASSSHRYSVAHLTRGPARTGWSLTACSTLVPGEGESRPIPITAALSAPTRWSGCGACTSWWGSGLH